MKTKHFAVIGDPIAHSLSPVMQTAALRTLGLPHTFEAIRVPKELLPATLDRLRRGELHGLNVTVPHKVEALQLCDLFTDEVAASGAVNTLFVDATGRLVGSNTDVEGFRADLLAEGLVPKKALLLGTGGAARAVLVALSRLDCEVTVAGRDQEAAKRMVA
ncbi:MAG: shikimate dehydrogenase family protein, partial [Polyangiales bacterium]